MNKRKVFIISILIFFVIVWIICIYKLSGMNNNNSNMNSTNIIYIFIEDTLKVTNKYDITSSNPSDKKLKRASRLLNKPLRKVMHASVYFVLGFLIVLVFNLLFDNKRYWKSLLITILLCIFFAALDEYHQTFVDGRTGQISDVVIDNIGALLGCLFYTTYYIVYRIGNKSKRISS